MNAQRFILSRGMQNDKVQPQMLQQLEDLFMKSGVDVIWFIW